MHARMHEWTRRKIAEPMHCMRPVGHDMSPREDACQAHGMQELYKPLLESDHPKY
jgi:hypothetical protein